MGAKVLKTSQIGGAKKGNFPLMSKLSSQLMPQETSLASVMFVTRVQRTY